MSILEYLKDFAAIAVREQQSAFQLSQWMNQQVDWVLDPTLLYNSDFWREFANGIQAPRKKYLLCYFLGKREWYFKYAQQMAKQLRLKLVLIPSWVEFVNYKETYRQGVGPKEFVALFRDAEFILTDSYHGSIFAIQFEKKFLHFKRFNDQDSNCQNIRIYSLFTALGLEKLILQQKNFAKNDIIDIHYQSINDRLSYYRKQSREYIKHNILE